MKKNLFTLIFACLLAVGAQATIHTIQVSDFAFTPATGMTVIIGDTVKWVWVSGSHTATSGTIPAGATAWNSPITSSVQSFSYKATVAGTYNYVCTPHASMGMIGSFSVVSPTGIATTEKSDLFKVSPNPASNVLRLELLHGAANMTLIDATGKMVYSNQFSGILDVPVAAFANGVYFIRVVQDGKQSFERIVVAH